VSQAPVKARLSWAREVMSSLVKTREVLKWMGARWRADLFGSRVTACVGASTNDGLLLVLDLWSLGVLG
jgi:hypothetical protein